MGIEGKIVFLVTCFMLISQAGWAGRPFTTEDAGVAGHGIIQFEAGSDYVFSGGDFESSVTATPIIGITDHFEFSADFPAQFLESEVKGHQGGFSDTSLIIKSLVLKERTYAPAILLRSQVKFSNGNEEKGFGSGDEDYGFIGVASKIWGSYGLHANTGYVLVGDDADRTLKNYFVYGFAFEYAWSKQLNVVAEWYGESGKHFDTTGFQHQESSPLIGLVYKITDSIALDIAGKIGFSTHEKPEYAVVVGFSINQVQAPFVQAARKLRSS